MAKPQSHRIPWELHNMQPPWPALNFFKPSHGQGHHCPVHYHCQVFNRRPRLGRCSQPKDFIAGFQPHVPCAFKNKMKPTNPNADTYVEKHRFNTHLSQFPANPLVEHPDLTHWGDTLVGHPCLTLLLDSLIWHSRGTLLLDTLVRHSSLTLL